MQVTLKGIFEEVVNLLKSGWFRLWIILAGIVFFISFVEFGNSLRDQSLPTFLFNLAHDLNDRFFYLIHPFGGNLPLPEAAIFYFLNNKPTIWAVSVTFVYCIFSAVAFYSLTWIRKGFKKDVPGRSD